MGCGFDMVAGWLEVKEEKRKGIKDSSWCFGLSNWVGEMAPLTEKEKMNKNRFVSGGNKPKTLYHIHPSLEIPI